MVTLERLRGELRQCLAEAEVYNKLEIESATQECNTTLARAQAALETEKEQAAAVYRQTIEANEQAHRQRIDAIEMNQSQQTEIATKQFQASQTLVSERLMVLRQQWGVLAADWTDPLWQLYTPDLKARPPDAVRVGTLIQEGYSDAYPSRSVSAMVRLTGATQHLVFLTSGGAKSSALGAMQAVCLRLLTSFAPGDVQFTFIDPVGLGNNVAGLLNLSELLRGTKAWTEAEQVRRRMEDLTGHMETVFQKYLTNRFPDIETYNDKAGLVAEPYQFLVVANFPVNFTEDSANRLLSIAANGPRTGVHLVMVIDTDQIKSNQSRLGGFVLDDLLRVSTVIEMNKGNNWQLRGLDTQIGAHRLTLDQLPSAEFVNDHILQPINEHANRTRDRVRVEFDEVIESAPWGATSLNGISIPIGRAGARETQKLELGKGSAQHVLIAGKIGMGKSSLLHAIVTGLAWAYPPEELELYLIDGKAGVEFKDYADYGLPHARVIAIQSEREFALSVLRSLNAEMKRRADELIKGYQNLPNYREKTQQKLSRILLVIDEFQDLFSDDDPLALEAGQIMSRLILQGRGFGIHILMASQSLATARGINRVLYDQMGVRIALQCSEEDSILILGSGNVAARRLTRVGEAIYNALNGALEGNNEFQVAYLNEEDRRKHLTTLKKQADQIAWKRRPIIFEGNALAHINANDELNTLIESPDWMSRNGRIAAKIWLGEPMELKAPTAARFRRQSAVNMMLLGTDERTAYALLTSSVLGLCAQYSPQNVEFYLVNLAVYDQPWAENFQALGEHMPHSIHVSSGRGIGDLIQKLAETVKTRVEQQKVNPQAELGWTIYCVIGGLQTARELRRIDEYTPSEFSETLSLVLRDGPEVGVHTIVWVSSYANVEQVLSPRDLQQFCLKVALQTGPENSRRFLNESLATNLGSFRAYFVDEDAGGKLEKFRPYELSTIAEIQTWAERLKTSKDGHTEN